MRTVEDRLNSARAEVQRSVARMPARTAHSVRRRHRNKTTAMVLASGVGVVALVVGTSMLAPSDSRDMAGPGLRPNVPGTNDLSPDPPIPAEPTAEDQPEAEQRTAEQRARDRLREIETKQDVEPISGYGDFSNVDYFYVNWYEVTRLGIECLRDQGFKVEAIPPGDGIDFSGVPPDQSEAAQRTLRACEAGLNLPEFTEPTDAQRTERYHYLLEVKECVESQGYETSAPPSLDTYLATGGLWSPYDLVVDTLGPQEWNALNEACPQNPRNR